MSWTTLGELSSSARAAVDPRGYVIVAGASWGLDWWIGADDRWHLPSREAAVRQCLLDDAPIVQTTMRVPGGDVHHRVMAYYGQSGPELAVEIVNDSAAPIAFAIALRPITLRNVGGVEEVVLRDRYLAVNGVEALVLPEPPRRALLVAGVDADPLETVLGGAAPEARDGSIRCGQHLGGAVLLVPLAHRATYQYRLMLAAVDDAARAGAGDSAPVETGAGPPRRGRSGPVAEGPRRSVPTFAAAARGWRAQIDHRVRLELPADRITGVLDAVRGHLLLASSTPASEDRWAAEVAVAAATAGLASAEPIDLIRAAPPEDVGAALWACGRLVGLGAPPPGVREVADAAEALERAVRQPGGDAAARAWAVAGFRAAAAMLANAGERRAATTARAWQAAASAALLDQGADNDAVVLGLALGVVPAGAGVGAHASTAVEAASDGRTIIGHPAQTLLRAVVALAGGDPKWVVDAVSVVDQASSTAAWPDVVAPDLATGCGLDGHSSLVTARFWSVVRASLIDDSTDGVVALAPGWPAGWDGLGVEAHGLPTRSGRVSFAVRWHGERPAMLWSIDGAPAPVSICAPGLDPAWSAKGADGDALLATPHRGGLTGVR